jgi:2-iminobutanoate/2-iminopropanoate deaminase
VRFLVLLAPYLLCFAGEHAQLQAVLPEKAAATNEAPGSPGIDAQDYVYVSGQGPRRLDGSTPPNFADQVRQSLENVRTVVQAAGLTMDHVVYVQVYMEDMNQYGTLA